MFREMLLVIFAVIGLAHGGPVKFAAISPNEERGPSFSNPSPFIMGGDIVVGREYPGLGSVNINQFHFCSGNIINSEWILTTASCMWLSPNNVLVGTNQIDNGGTVHNLVKVILHEDYNETDSWINDIALLKLGIPIEFGEGLAPVTLPEKGEDTPVGSLGTIAGWGAFKNVEETSNDLRKLDMKLYDHEKCKEEYIYFEKHVYPTQICGTANNRTYGPAFGDSADPFIVDGKLIGLISWQRMRNGLSYPDVMTKVSEYIDWINEHINA